MQNFNRILVYPQFGAPYEIPEIIRTFRRMVIAGTRVMQRQSRTLIRVPGVTDPAIYLEETLGFRVSGASRHDPNDEFYSSKSTGR